MTFSELILEPSTENRTTVLHKQVNGENKLPVFLEGQKVENLMIDVLHVRVLLQSVP